MSERNTAASIKSSKTISTKQRSKESEGLNSFVTSRALFALNARRSVAERRTQTQARLKKSKKTRKLSLDFERHHCSRIQRGQILHETIMS